MIHFIFIITMALGYVEAAAVIVNNAPSKHKFVTTYQERCQDDVKAAFAAATLLYQAKLKMHESVTIHVRCQPIPGNTLGMTIAPTHADPFEENDNKKIKKACTQALLKQKLAGSAAGQKIRYVTTPAYKIHTGVYTLECIA
jgi:hypothetical protein